MIGQTVETGSQFSPLPGRTLVDAESLAIGKYDAKAIIGAAHAAKSLETCRHWLVGSQERCHEPAATGSVRAVLRRVPEIRQRRESPAPSDAKPRAAGGQIAARENPRIVRPPVGRQRGTRVILVPIGRDEEGKLGVLAPRHEDQTHGRYLATTPTQAYTNAGAQRLRPTNPRFSSQLSPWPSGPLPVLPLA